MLRQLLSSHDNGQSMVIRGLSKKFVEFVDKNKTTGAINL